MKLNTGGLQSITTMNDGGEIVGGVTVMIFRKSKLIWKGISGKDGKIDVPENVGDKVFMMEFKENE